MIMLRKRDRLRENRVYLLREVGKWELQKHWHQIRHQLPELYLLCRAAGMQRLQMRLPGSNGNRVLISRIATPHTLRAEYTKPGKQGGKWGESKIKREIHKARKKAGIGKKGEQQKKKKRLVTTGSCKCSSISSLHWYMPLRRENTFIEQPCGTQVCSGEVCGVETPRSLVQDTDTHTQTRRHGWRKTIAWWVKKPVNQWLGSRHFFKPNVMIFLHSYTSKKLN